MVEWEFFAWTARKPGSLEASTDPRTQDKADHTQTDKTDLAWGFIPCLGDDIFNVTQASCDSCLYKLIIKGFLIQSQTFVTMTKIVQLFKTRL